MDDLTLVAFGAALVVGLVASWTILRRRSASDESPFAASTEGMNRCPQCGLANTWTDRTCAGCGSDLPG